MTTSEEPSLVVRLAGHGNEDVFQDRIRRAHRNNIEARVGSVDAEQIRGPNVDGFVHLDEDGAPARAVYGFYAAQEKGEKCPFRVPLESSQRMPKTLNRLRVAFASESRRATG